MIQSVPLSIICPYHSPLSGYKSSSVVFRGWYCRRSDGIRLRRFFCNECRRGFSEATLTLEYRQRKRSINDLLFRLLASNNSMRRSAVLVCVTRRTVERRLLYFSKVASRYQEKFIKSLEPVRSIHFDDMETSEHTKMKPLSIPIAVEHPSRLILSFDVVSMPPKGLLAKKSRQKYGPRRDDRLAGWNQVLNSVAKICVPDLAITTDSHMRYPEVIRNNIPFARHIQVKGRRGCVAGQGELKVGGWDPLFSLNHTAAMLRANICRLIRRTWCTTKKKDRLFQHIMIYVMWHNESILARQQRRKKCFPFPLAA